MNSKCEKVKFASKEFTDFHIEKNKEANKLKGLTARSYLCKCGSWHITSKPPVANVIKELNDKIEALEIDNEAYREQLLEQIKKTEFFKAEAEVLKQWKHNTRSNESAEIKILRTQNNKLKEGYQRRGKELQQLLNLLNQIK